MVGLPWTELPCRDLHPCGHLGSGHSSTKPAAPAEVLPGSTTTGGLGGREGTLLRAWGLGAEPTSVPELRAGGAAPLTREASRRECRRPRKRGGRWVCRCCGESETRRRVPSETWARLCLRLGFRLSLDPALGLGLDQDSEFSLRPGPSQPWAGLSVRLCTRQLKSVRREQAVLSFEKAAPLPPPPVQQEVGWTQPGPRPRPGPPARWAASLPHSGWSRGSLQTLKSPF